jgi:predicted acetyltransferase
MITCDIDNYASEKTILANNGVFEKVIDAKEQKVFLIEF